MTIEKLKSGSYRVKLQIDKKRYSVTVPYKPTEKEAYALILERVEKEDGVKGTFKYYCKQYITIKENVLSPRTIKGYNDYIDLLPEWFSRLDLGEIRHEDVQRLINELSVTRSPKTVRNYHGFVSAIFAMYRPGFSLHTTLPQKVKREDYIPSENDVRAVLNCADGTEYQTFLKLACMGLRRGEICALNVSDLDDNNVLHINKALVLDKDNNLVIKTTKTTSSTRNVPIPESLANEIRKQGYIFRQSPNSVIKWLNRTQDKLGIPRFSLHKFRHFFVSSLSDKNVPVETILQLGGYETDAVMKTVYRHNMKREDEKRKIIDDLTNGLF